MKCLATAIVLPALIGLPIWSQAAVLVSPVPSTDTVYPDQPSYSNFARIHFAHQGSNSLFSDHRLKVDPYTLRSSVLTPSTGNMRVVGEFGIGKAGSGLSIPVYIGQAWDNYWGASYYNGLGIHWQHRLNREHSIMLTAQYGENSFLRQSSLSTVNTQAAFIWSTRWQNSLQPSLSGGVIIGGDRPQDRERSYLERSYYGLIVGGKMTISQRHTPYVSLSLLRNNYTVGDPGYRFPRIVDYTRLSLGWNWQILPNLQLRADTYYNYGMNDPTYSNYQAERSRIMFSTSFTFK